MESIVSWAISSLGNSTLNDFVSPAALLTAALASLLQNGQPKGEFLPSRGLPFFLDGSTSDMPWINRTANGTMKLPWGNRTANGTNPADVPDTGMCSRRRKFPTMAGQACMLNVLALCTGVTRHYDFTIERGVIAPDGVNRSSILVNHQYPGVSSN